MQQYGIYNSKLLPISNIDYNGSEYFAVVAYPVPRLADRAPITSASLVTSSTIASFGFLL